MWMILPALMAGNLVKSQEPFLRRKTLYLAGDIVVEDDPDLSWHEISGRWSPDLDADFLGNDHDEALDVHLLDIDVALVLSDGVTGSPISCLFRSLYSLVRYPHFFGH